MQQTFAQFRSEILAELYPIGVPDNLAASVDAYFPTALIDLQRWVKCLRTHNVNVISQCNTYWDCGLSVVDSPSGRIQSVYTVANEHWCDKVTYFPMDYKVMREQAKVLSISVTPPAQPQRPPLPQGILYADVSTDDIVQGRSRRGSFAIHNGRMYILPWLHSNELLVIEWDGIKQLWLPGDLVDFEPATKTAVKHYIRSQFYSDFTQDSANAQKYNALYENQRADLIYECRMQNTPEEPETERYLPNSQQIIDEKP